jgi:hypothetical protein
MFTAAGANRGVWQPSHELRRRRQKGMEKYYNFQKNKNKKITIISWF